MYKRSLLKLLGLTALAAIGVMAVSASAANAKWQLLLNGSSVSSGGGPVTSLESSVEVENGLELSCAGGTGSATFELTEEGKKTVGSASGTLEGCVWVGSEKSCTINDGGKGLINVGGSGELTMAESETYIVSSSEEFATIYTEGPFCTIPEEEVVSGTLKCHLLNPLEGAKVHVCHREAGSLQLGNSAITRFEGEVHMMDEDPNATFALHLVAL